MSLTALTAQSMTKLHGRYDVTVRVAYDNVHQPDPAAFAVAASRAASGGDARRRQRAHGRRDHLWLPFMHPTGPQQLPSPWPSSPRRSSPTLGPRHPAGERLVPAVVRRFEEHCLLEQVVAAVACDADVSQTAAPAGGFPGRLADARCPAHLRLAGPQLMTERAAFRLVLEQRSGN
jgi:hypothetical protein